MNDNNKSTIINQKSEDRSKKSESGIQDPASSIFKLEIKATADVKVGEIVFVKSFMPEVEYTSLEELMSGDDAFLKKNNIGTLEGQVKFDDVIRMFIKSEGHMVTRIIKGGVKLWPVAPKKFNHRVYLGSEVMGTGKVVSAMPKRNKKKEVRRQKSVGNSKQKK